MQPLPAGVAGEAERRGDLGRPQRHPAQRREGEVAFPGGRAGGVPVDESDQPAVPPDGVVRAGVVMTDDQARLPTLATEPPGVLRRYEARGGVVQPAHPVARLPQRLGGAGPLRPRQPVPDGLPGQVAEHLPALFVDAEDAGRLGEPDGRQMPQHRVYGRRPRLRWPAYGVADPYRPPARRCSVILPFYSRRAGRGIRISARSSPPPRGLSGQARRGYSPPSSPSITHDDGLGCPGRCLSRSRRRAGRESCCLRAAATRGPGGCCASGRRSGGPPRAAPPAGPGGRRTPAGAGSPPARWRRCARSGSAAR